MAAIGIFFESRQIPAISAKLLANSQVPEQIFVPFFLYLISSLLFPSIFMHFPTLKCHFILNLLVTYACKTYIYLCKIYENNILFTQITI